MKIEILCTGDEVLTGKTINTNYSHMAGRFAEAGLSVVWGTTVGDDREQLINAVSLAGQRADAVIVNGGLGPTVDDLSQEIAAVAAGVELQLYEPWLERMSQWYQRRGRVMPPNNKKQALLPAGAEFIDNPIGTACGFAIDIGQARFFFTPGVPREMRRMIDEQIIPRLLQLSGIKRVTRLKRFHSFGIGESRADQLLQGIEAMTADGSIKLGFQAHYPQLETKLAVHATETTELEAKLKPVADEVRTRLGNYIVAEDQQTLTDVILSRLEEDQLTIATMETHTAGAITARLLACAGGEDWIKRGVVSCNLNELCAAANLTSAVERLDTNSARRLAESLRQTATSDVALAVLMNLDSGADAMDSGADLTITIADRSNTAIRGARLIGNREWVRLGAIEMGLDCLRRYLLGLPIDERIDFEKH